MSLIEIGGHTGGLETLEALTRAVHTLSRAGVECHGIPISPGALYATIEVQDRLANYAVCILRSNGFEVAADARPATAILSIRRT